MWKNFIARKGVGVYVVFEIKGANIDGFINYVRRRGIIVYNLIKQHKNKVRLTVRCCDSENLFAFASQMCYNIKKIRYTGLGYPLFYLTKNLGALIGAILFILVTVFASDLVLGVNFTGSGSVYKREINQYLNSIGVCQYARFSKLDLSKVEDGILSTNPHLSFAGCKKVGNTLVVDVAISKDQVQRLEGNAQSLVSPVDGVIESIKVYRGTAVVGVGDAVKEGQLLVDGYSIVKEQTIKTNVIACVSIIAEKEFIYYSLSANDEKSAKLFAESEMQEREILSTQTKVKEQDGKYCYLTKIKYKRILYVG